MTFTPDRDNVARADPGPADDAYMITPSDSANLPTQCRAIRVGVAGDVHVLTRIGQDRTLTLLDGEVFTCGVLKVFATGTTATDLLGYI